MAGVQWCFKPASPTIGTIENYMKLDPLPIGQVVTIHSIGALNYNPLKKTGVGQIHWRDFRKGWPDQFPAGKIPENDYMDDDEVHPATVKYSLRDKPDDIQLARIKYLLWFPLNDAFSDCMSNQIMHGVKNFPIKDVLIDEHDQWVVKVFRAANG